MKINKNVIFLIVLFFLFIFLLFIYHDKDEKKNVLVGENEFAMEVADSEKERVKGLRGRDRLCEKCGMLFVFPEKENYAFEMKGMKISLDMLWISNNKIIYIKENIPPDYPDPIKIPFEFNKVIEIKSGSVEKYNIKVGDEIFIK